MNYDQIYAIAAQGMNLEKLRVDVVATNIANQYSLQAAGNSPYQTMEVIATAKPFADYLFSSTTSDIADVQLVPQQIPPNKVYHPGHPAADETGYINYPGLSTVNEMTNLLRASRGYEANIKIINTAHNLYLQALRIGEDR